MGRSSRPKVRPWSRRIHVSLKEFLAAEAEKLQSERSKAMKKRDEWIESVGRLLNQIEEWLGEADSGRILTFQKGHLTLREVGIGTYDVPFVLIELGAREVSIKPVARFVAGPLSSTGAMRVLRSYGRVDMSNGLDKYMMFRIEKHLDGPWIIIEEDGDRSNSFDRDSFESAFQRLLE
jgi:hypothetical protein